MEKHKAKYLCYLTSTLVSLEVKGQVSKCVLTQISKVKLNFKKSSKPTDLLIYSFGLETYLNVLILKNGSFSLEVRSTKSSMTLMFVYFFHDVFYCVILTDLVALVESLRRIRIRRIFKYCGYFAASKRVDRFTQIGSIVRTYSASESCIFGLFS